MNLLILVGPRLDNICQIRRKWYYIHGDEIFFNLNLALCHNRGKNPSPLRGLCTVHYCSWRDAFSRPATALSTCPHHYSAHGSTTGNAPFLRTSFSAAPAHLLRALFTRCCSATASTRSVRGCCAPLAVPCARGDSARRIRLHPGCLRLRIPSATDAWCWSRAVFLSAIACGAKSVLATCCLLALALRMHHCGNWNPHCAVTLYSPPPLWTLLWATRRHASYKIQHSGYDCKEYVFNIQDAIAKNAWSLALSPCPSICTCTWSLYPSLP
jgi:hypothetical protein